MLFPALVCYRRARSGLIDLAAHANSKRKERFKVLNRYYHLRQYALGGYVDPDLERDAQQIEAECAKEYEQRKALEHEMFQAKTKVLSEIGRVHALQAAKDSHLSLSKRFRRYWRAACEHRFSVDGVLSYGIDPYGPMFNAFANTLGFRNGKALVLAVAEH